MAETADQSMELYLIDSSYILNQSLNRHCIFDGAAIIYLTGAHLVYHNVFQNHKAFIERSTLSPVVSMAAFKGPETSVALAVKGSTYEIQFYLPGRRTANVPLSENWEVNDMIMVEKKRLLLVGKSQGKPVLALVDTHHKVSVIELHEEGHRLINGERGVVVVTGRGYYEFNPDSEILKPEKLYPQLSFNEVLFMENGCQVLVGDREVHLISSDGDYVNSFSYSRLIGGEVECEKGVKVGKNALVSIKNSFTLAHLQITHDNSAIEMSELYEYPQKIRGAIVSMETSMDEMNLAIAFRTIHKDQPQIQHFMFNLSVLSRDKKFINPFTRLTHGGIEFGEVNCLQRVIPSEVYALAGSQIVNYGYVEHIEKKYKYSIHESPRIVAVHPLGHQIMCAFDNAIKFYVKVEMELVEAWTQNAICSAARYMDSGLLALSLYEDGLHNVTLYNPNSFTRVRTYPNIYLKHSLWKICFDDAEAEMVLYSHRDIFVHRFTTGEKIGEFREKKELTEANCVEYDPSQKQIVAACKKNLVVCQKTESYCVNFSNQTTLSIGEEVTSILVKDAIKMIFLGTAEGKVLFGDYPLQQLHSSSHSIHLRQVRVHHEPITQMLMSNNHKFMWCKLRGQGLGMLKAKWLASHTVYNPFDISNYNFIETSSLPYLETVHEKLKGLLERRKTIFNELEEFKKEWELRRLKQTKNIGIYNKRRELEGINDTLSQIEQCKEQKQRLADELAQFERERQLEEDECELRHEKQLMAYYSACDSLQNRRDSVKERCLSEERELVGECRTNLAEIRSELEGKFSAFANNYRMMRQNLEAHRRKVEMEAEEEEAVRAREVSDMRDNLEKEEDDLHRKGNELKGEITRGKRELHRFGQRKDFLQNKRRFFEEELRFCNQQEHELKGIKESLNQQLKQIEEATHTKEQRLRKYFIENKGLIKYQSIHDTLSRQGKRELEFMDQQHIAIRKEITQLQQEILGQAEEREKRSLQIAAKREELKGLKEHNHELRERETGLWVQVGEVESSIAKMKGESAQEFSKIYQRCFVEGGLERLLDRERVVENEEALADKQRVERGIDSELASHKDYLTSNLELFEKYNTKTIDEIRLNNLKYQAQNYNLISECHTRKQQIEQQKVVLHQLVDSYRDVHSELKNIQHSRPPRAQTAVKKENRNAEELPFRVFQRTREAQKVQIRAERSEPSLIHLHKQSSAGQYRRLLEVSRCVKGNNGRRIQTAMLKKRGRDSVEDDKMGDCSIVEHKPRTAAQSRRGKGGAGTSSATRLFSRPKTNSKPTTATTHTAHTRSKQSLFF